jgi:hypothetical protein
VNFEIEFNDQYYYQTGKGNVYQSCIEVLHDWVLANPHSPIPLRPFYTKNITEGYEEEISLADIVSIMSLSADYEYEQCQN